MSDYDAFEAAWDESPLEVTRGIIAASAEAATQAAVEQLQPLRLQAAIERETQIAFDEATKIVLQQGDIDQRSFEARARIMEPMLDGIFNGVPTVEAAAQALRTAYFSAADEEHKNYWSSVEENPGTRKFGL